MATPSTTTLVKTSTVDMDHLPTPFDFGDDGPSNFDMDAPADFLADTFDYPDDWPLDDGNSNHIHAIIISSVILGIGLIALIGAALFVWSRRRQRARYERDAQEVAKDGMALQSVESFSMAKNGSVVDLREGGLGMETNRLSMTKTEGGSEVPPPTYDEVVPAHHRVPDGAVVRRGQTPSQGQTNPDTTTDERRMSRENTWEEAERMEGGGDWPSVGTREFI